VFSRATSGGAVVLTLLEYFEYVFLDTKICLESAWHWLSILIKTFFVKLPFLSLN
jgi:hypothetical protein